MTPSLFSECAAKYAIACADPMNPAAIGACVPTGNSRPSFKTRTILRGSITIGSGGTGFLLYCPCLANDGILAVYTKPGYAGNNDPLDIFTVDPVTGAISGFEPGVDVLVNTTGPYNTSALYTANAEQGASPAATGRIVSAGVSLQYAGSVMDMGGTMTSLSRSTHQTVLLNGGGTIPTLSPSYVQRFAEARMARVSDQKVWIVDSARLDGEENYSSTMNQQDGAETLDKGNVLYPFSQGTWVSQALTGSSIFASTGTPANAFIVTGAKSGAVFNFEIVQHMEFQGIAAQYALSPSHQDPVGFGKVREAASAVPALAVEYPQASAPSLMRHALDMASEHLAPKALAAGGAMLKAALSGGGLAASLGAGAAMLM